MVERRKHVKSQTDDVVPGPTWESAEGQRKIAELVGMQGFEPHQSLDGAVARCETLYGRLFSVGNLERLQRSLLFFVAVLLDVRHGIKNCPEVRFAHHAGFPPAEAAQLSIGRCLAILPSARPTLVGWAPS